MKSLKITSVGSDRKRFNALLVTLEPEVEAVFPDAKPVNDALEAVILSHTVSTGVVK